MLRSIIPVSWLALTSLCIASSGWAAFQATPEVKIPSPLGETKPEGSDCDQKPKLTPPPPRGEAATKNKAVDGMVGLGELPADKVEPNTPPPTAKFLNPPMETCK